MNKTTWQKIQPHLIAIAIFLSVSIIYCLPALKGLMVNQHDLLGWKGMAQQSFEFKEKYGHFPLWTNSLFSGMPAYQVAIDSKYNFSLAWIDHIIRLGLPAPISLFFLSCVCFYLLGNVLKLRHWVAVFGALAYSFASYNAIIVAVGHTTKFSSMGYAPAVLAGFLLLTQRKYIWGFITTLTFSTLLFYQNHLQIVYYTLIILLVAAIAFAIKTFKEKDFSHLLKTGALALIAAGISAGSYAVMLMPLNEYAKETMRGGRSELTNKSTTDEKTKGGLDKSYAFTWSYGIDETLTIALPNFKGGSSGPAALGEESKAVEAMQEAQLPQDAMNYFYNYLSAYWGPQLSGTSGPVFFGIIIVMLFIAGIFTVKDWHRNWLLVATLIGLILAWGKNFSAINYFLFDHLPLYNKFRAPSMAMVIPQMTFAILASLGLQSILYGDFDRNTLIKKLKPAAGIVGLLAIVLTMVYFIADFKSENDSQIQGAISGTIERMMSQGQQPTSAIAQQANQIGNSIMNGLETDRKSIYASDLIRSLAFLFVGILLIYLFLKNKLSQQIVVIGLSILLMIELIPVDARYLNEKNYIAEDEFLEKFTPNNADLQIKQDTGYFRVFDRDHDFSDDSRSAYHHNSVGGYHPAKLALYQDLIEHQITKGNMQLFNMLNTKYFIIAGENNQQPMAIPNPNNLGAAWLVNNIQYVKNADEEMKSLDSIQPKETAYIDLREQSKVTETPVADSTAQITFVENKNDLIRYQSNARTPQFAVFSEIYYPYGWNAFIDGKPAPIVKVDYAFRGLSLPAGNHAIEFRFEPKSKAMGDMISLILGIISWILVLGGIFLLWKNNQATKVAS